MAKNRVSVQQLDYKLEISIKLPPHKNGLKLCLYTAILIGTISYPCECDQLIKVWRHFLMHECILLPSYVLYNMHQDRKSAQLIAGVNVYLCTGRRENVNYLYFHF